MKDIGLGDILVQRAGLLQMSVHRPDRVVPDSFIAKARIPVRAFPNRPAVIPRGRARLGLKSGPISQHSARRSGAAMMWVSSLRLTWRPCSRPGVLSVFFFFFFSPCSSVLELGFSWQKGRNPVLKSSVFRKTGQSLRPARTSLRGGYPGQAPRSKLLVQRFDQLVPSRCGGCVL